MAGTCSPVDQMYITALRAIATLNMAENHIKTDSIGLQLVGMSRRNDHKHHPAPFSLYKRATTASHCISDHENCGQKKPGKRQSGRLPCLDKAVLAQGGGGG